MSGGVALNCVGNGRLLREGPFKGIWIQPAAGDAGSAVGAALSAYHQYLGKPRTIAANGDSMKGSYLGPRFTNDQIGQTLRKIGAVYRRLEEDQLLEEMAQHLASEKVVGWFQGRMEFGPSRVRGAKHFGRSSKQADAVSDEFED